jgi:hypothetical protein
MFDSYDDAVEYRLRVVDQARRGVGGSPAAARIRVGDWWAEWRSGVIRRANTLDRYDSLSTADELSRPRAAPNREQPAHPKDVGATTA